MKRKQKVAIISYKSILSKDGYTISVSTICEVLASLGLNIELFSFGNSSSTKKLANCVEHTIKEFPYPERLSFYKILDFMTLTLFGYRYSLKKMNINKEIISKLKVFEPDYIITCNFILPFIISRYKQINKNKIPKVILYSDSPRIIDTSFREFSNFPYPLNYFKIFLKNTYLKYYMELYAQMINYSDMIVTPTKADKSYIRKMFNIPTAKINIAPPFYAPQNILSKTPREVKAINNILFIGSYNYWPNKEAIFQIEKKIAPRLPNKTFWICGNGCPKYTHKNVKYLGKVNNLSKLLNSSDLLIAPILSGTGIKTKIFEYACAGKPILGTSLALAGYPTINNVNVLIENNIDEFYKRICELDENPIQIKILQNNVKKIIRYFSKDTLINTWKKILKN